MVSRDVAVIGHMIEPNPTACGRSRSGPGCCSSARSTGRTAPTSTAWCWFVDAVLPLIEAELKWETRLTIAGYIAPGIDMSRFEHHPRITLRGPVG